MPAFPRRQYAGAAASTTTTNSLNTVDTSVTLASVTGWPSAASIAFYVVIDPGTSAEEKVSATISGSTLTITRAQDDTTAASHSSGATIYPCFTANDADEANALVALLTTKGDILVTTGSELNRLPVGANDLPLVADSTATNGLTYKQIVAAGIGALACTSVKVASLTTATKTDSYVLVATDRNTKVVMNKATATTITVDTSLFAANDQVFLENIGAGACTVTAGTATVVSAGSLVIPSNGSGELSFTSTGAARYFPSAVIATSKVVQVVNTQTGAMATGSTAIPWDDTIPQITEGTEFMTRTITPTNAANILIIEVVAAFSFNASAFATGALFVGTTPDALAAINVFAQAEEGRILNLTHSVAAGVTSELTFRFRIGGNANTVTFNGLLGVRTFGGVNASSITITEYTP